MDKSEPYDYENPLKNRESKPLVDFLKDDNWQSIDISKDFLDFDKPYRPPRYTLDRDGVPFADVGEVHVVSGKPGNGKTGLMAQLIAATIGGKFGNTVARKVGHKINGTEEFHEVPTKVLYVDTEQGEDDTIGLKNRIISMAGVSTESAKEHLKILRLRDTELAQDRWRKILKAIYEVQPTDIFLDGMLDIVEDYNDQKECQPIVRKCMMLATYYDTSLWVVLHENPLINKLVGTLGSITQRKVSEIFTVIKVKQADLKKSEQRDDLPDIYFRVKQTKARGKDVADWLFRFESTASGLGVPVEFTPESMPEEPETDKTADGKHALEACRAKLDAVAPIKNLTRTKLRDKLRLKFQIGSPAAYNIIDYAVYYRILDKIDDRYTLQEEDPIQFEDGKQNKNDPF